MALQESDIQKGSLIDLAGFYRTTLDWQSILDFYYYEISFLHKLLNSYFFRLTSPSQASIITVLDRRLQTASRRLKILRKAVLRYKHYLTGLDESSVWISSREILKRYAQTNDRLQYFTSQMMADKKEIFGFIETQNVLRKRAERKILTARIEEAYEEGTIAL